MSAFWGGFAGEGVRQLDAIRQDAREDDKLAKLRKYQEERYAIERGDRKADSLEEWNFDRKVKEYDEGLGIKEVAPGYFMQDTLGRDAAGNITITSNQVEKNSPLVEKFLQKRAKEKNDAEQEDLATESARLGIEEKRFNNAHMGEEYALKKRATLADIAASERSGREKDKEPVFGPPKWEVDARNSIASGDGTYYVPEGTKLAGLSEVTMGGETSQDRLQKYVTQIARILQNPKDPNYVGATKIWLRDIAPKLKKKDK